MKKNSVSNYIIGVLIVTLGIFIMAKKDTFLSIVMVASGIVAIVGGISDIRVFSHIKPFNYSKFITKSAIIKIVGNIIIGTLCIVMPLLFAKTVIKVILYIIAAYLLLSGILALIQSRTLRKQEGEQFKNFRTNLTGQGIVFILIAILFFVAPMEVTYTVINIIGIALFLFGAGLIVFTAKSNKSQKTIEATYTESAEPENK